MSTSRYGRRPYWVPQREVCCVGDGPEQPEKGRYELYVDNKLAGFTEYCGLAGQLVQNALDDVRNHALAALPFCPYVRRFIVRHPQYLDLVPEEQHDRFVLSPT